MSSFNALFFCSVVFRFQEEKRSSEEEEEEDHQKDEREKGNLFEVGVDGGENGADLLDESALGLIGLHGDLVVVVDRVEEADLTVEVRARVFETVVRLEVLFGLSELGGHLLVQLDELQLVLLQLGTRWDLVHLALDHFDVLHNHHCPHKVR